jgi:acyl carrier protein
MEETKNTIRSYILDEFLPGEDPALLTDETPLITGGILDSLATLKLVAFLQDQYGVDIQPFETSVEYMDSVPDIAQLVESKLA